MRSLITLLLKLASGLFPGRSKIPTNVSNEELTVFCRGNSFAFGSVGRTMLQQTVNGSGRVPETLYALQLGPDQLAEMESALVTQFWDTPMEPGEIDTYPLIVSYGEPSRGSEEEATIRIPPFRIFNLSGRKIGLHPSRDLCYFIESHPFTVKLLQHYLETDATLGANAPLWLLVIPQKSAASGLPTYKAGESPKESWEKRWRFSGELVSAAREFDFHNFRFYILRSFWPAEDEGEI